mgnify:CR=1 FL=1|tara:strand:+ start:343 stop:537 length:195 start_codon:yes stop_codon:yes gene_type:complete
MKKFTYKGYTFNYHIESDPNSTWIIVTLHSKSVYYGQNLEVVGDGLAEAKWLASRKLNAFIKNN